MLVCESHKGSSFISYKMKGSARCQCHRSVKEELNKLEKQVELYVLPSLPLYLCHCIC